MLSKSHTFLRVWLMVIVVMFCDKAAFTQVDSGKIRLDSASIIFRTNRIQALQLSGGAIEWYTKRSNSNGMIVAYLSRAEMLYKCGQYASSLQDFRKVILISVQNKLNDPGTLGRAYQGAMQSCFVAGRFDEGIQLSLDGEKDVSIVGRKTIQYELLRLRAKCFAAKNEFNTANQILESLLRLPLNEFSDEERAKTLFQYGEILQQQGNLEQSEKYLKEASDLATRKGLTDLTIQTNDALADVYHNTQNSNLELEIRNSNLALNTQNNDFSGMAIQNYEIGNAYLQMGDLQRAEDYIQKANALNPIKSIDGDLNDAGYNSADLRHGAVALKNLALEFQKKNELEKALKYYRDYSEMLDSANALQQLELQNAMVLSTDLGRNQQRIEWLEKENELNSRNISLMRNENDLKASQVSRRNIIIASLMSLLVVASILGFLLFRNAKARRRSEQLVVLQGMNGQMNPHFIFNALNSVNEYVAQNNERETNRFIAAFSKLMRRVLDDSGRTFISLSDEIELLKVYLQLEHSRFPEKFEYDLVVKVGDEASEIMIPPMMIQPLVENAIWHGLRYRNSKGELRIVIEQEGKLLRIWTEDNGVGIQKSADLKTGNQKLQKSHAIANMKRRINILNELFGCQITVHTKELNGDENFPGTSVLFQMNVLTSDQLSLHP